LSTDSISSTSSTSSASPGSAGSHMPPPGGSEKGKGGSGPMERLWQLGFHLVLCEHAWPPASGPEVPLQADVACVSA
jgi:hypothetical protein